LRYRKACAISRAFVFSFTSDRLPRSCEEIEIFAKSNDDRSSSESVCNWRRTRGRRRKTSTRRLRTSTDPISTRSLGPFERKGGLSGRGDRRFAPRHPAHHVVSQHGPDGFDGDLGQAAQPELA